MFDFRRTHQRIFTGSTIFDQRHQHMNFLPDQKKIETPAMLGTNGRLNLHMSVGLKQRIPS